jgi:predicted dehydrogenase
MRKSALQGALIGAGDISWYHLKAWEQISEVSIIAIADLDRDRARDRANEFGIDISHTYTSASELLTQEAHLNFIDIATPPETHLKLVKQAAAQGLHINCQKPFAPSLKEGRAMIEICAQANVLLNVNENWRWRTWYRQIRGLIVAGRIGQPVYAKIFAHGSTWLPDSDRPPQHRFYRWNRAVLYDIGIHHIDIFRFLLGEPESIYARLGYVNPQLPGDDRAIVILSYPEVTAILDLSMSSHAPRGVPNRRKHLLEDVRIEGTDGTIELISDSQKGDLIRLTSISDSWKKPAYYGDPEDAYLQSFVRAQSHFIDGLRHNSPLDTLATDNIQTLALVLAAYHSAEIGEVVRIQEFIEN